MTARSPLTQTVPIAGILPRHRDLVKKVARHGTRIVVEEDGQPLAALVSARDLEQLRRLDASREDPWRVIDDINARNRDKAPDEVERDVAAAITKLRAGARAKRERGSVERLDFEHAAALRTACGPPSVWPSSRRSPPPTAAPSTWWPVGRAESQACAQVFFMRGGPMVGSEQPKRLSGRYIDSVSWIQSA